MHGHEAQACRQNTQNMLIKRLKINAYPRIHTIYSNLTFLTGKWKNSCVTFRDRHREQIKISKFKYWVQKNISNIRQSTQNIA